MKTLTQDEINVMNEISLHHRIDWIMNPQAAMIVAVVCLKTGVNDASALVKSWDTEQFQLALVQMGLMNVDTGSVN